MEKAICEKKRRSISSYIWAIDQDHQNPILLTIFVKRVGSSSVQMMRKSTEMRKREREYNSKPSMFFNFWKKIVLI
jgi:hypothetical protein